MLAIVLTASRIGRRTVRGLFSWAAGARRARRSPRPARSPPRASPRITWWPNGDYEPIRPGERGTLSEVATSVSSIPSGRAAWTLQREQEHGREPTVRERRADDAGTIGPVGQDEEEIAPPATTTTPAEQSTTTTPAGETTTPPAAPTETAPAAPAEEPVPVPPAEAVPSETVPTTTVPVP